MPLRKNGHGPLGVKLKECYFLLKCRCGIQLSCVIIEIKKCTSVIKRKKVAVMQLSLIILMYQFFIMFTMLLYWDTT